MKEKVFSEIYIRERTPNPPTMKNTNQNISRKNTPIIGIKPHVEVNRSANNIKSINNPPMVKLRPRFLVVSFDFIFNSSRERRVKSIKTIGYKISIIIKGR